MQGYGRASYGDATLDAGLPRSGLRPTCPYGTVLALILAEAREDFVECVGLSTLPLFLSLSETSVEQQKSDRSPQMIEKYNWIE